jgi:hypothetical protein
MQDQKRDEVIDISEKLRSMMHTNISPKPVSKPISIPSEPHIPSYVHKPSSSSGPSANKPSSSSGPSANKPSSSSGQPPYRTSKNKKSDQPVPSSDSPKRKRGPVKDTRKVLKKMKDMKASIIVLKGGVITLNRYGVASFVNMMLIDTSKKEELITLSNLMKPSYLFSTAPRYFVLFKVIIADSVAPYGEFGCVMYSTEPRIEDDGVVDDRYDVLITHFDRKYSSIEEMTQPFQWVFDEKEEESFKSRHSKNMRELYSQKGVDIDQGFAPMLKRSCELLNGSMNFDTFFYAFEQLIVRDYDKFNNSIV